MKAKYLLTALLIASGTFAITAQNSLPAPGSGSMQNSLPAPGTGGSFNPGGPQWTANPGFAPGMWGSPWMSPVYAPSSGFVNSGTTNVVGVGYDAQGIWRTIPMTVAYNYNGVQYNVTVINAWNPWTDTWNYNIDDQAFNTTYFLRGNQYNFYTVLPTGTFYFNL